MDPLAIRGLQPGASAEEITEAYHRRTAPLIINEGGVTKVTHQMSADDHKRFVSAGTARMHHVSNQPLDTSWGLTGQWQQQPPPRAPDPNVPQPSLMDCRVGPPPAPSVPFTPTPGAAQYYASGAGPPSGPEGGNPPQYGNPSPHIGTNYNVSQENTDAARAPFPPLRCVRTFPKPFLVIR